MKSLITLMVASTLAFSAQANSEHQQHAHHTAHAPGLNEMQQELVKSMAEMHGDMEKGMQYTDADMAFAASMLPHHQGAVKMAEVELKYGKDPELRKLAQAIIDAQESEIQFMQEWLKKNQK